MNEPHPDPHHAATPDPDAAAPDTAPDKGLSKDERTMGMLAHLSSLAGYVIPFGNIIGPLVVWLIKREEMPFVDDQGKEALNFQITVMLAVIACFALFFLILPLLLIPVIGIVDLVFTVIAAVKANEGEHYRYPMTLRLIS